MKYKRNKSIYQGGHRERMKAVYAETEAKEVIPKVSPKTATISITGPSEAGVGWHVYQAVNSSLWGPDAKFQWSTDGSNIKYAQEEKDTFKFYIEDLSFGTGDINVYCNVYDPFDGTNVNLSAKTTLTNAPQAPVETPRARFTTNAIQGMLSGQTLILDPSMSVLPIHHGDHSVKWVFDSEHMHFSHVTKDVEVYEVPLMDFIDPLRGTPGFLHLNVQMNLVHFDCAEATTSQMFILEVTDIMLERLKKMLMEDPSLKIRLDRMRKKD